MEEVLPPDIVDATAKLLVESGAVGQRAVRFSRSRMAVGIYLAFDWMMPGQFEAFAHRKAFCERQVRKGIEAGASQVLVLGAGYDTLGWRLAPEFASVNFFEIDHPATARLKAKGIEAMGQPTNLHLIAEDLGERQLVDVLRADATWNSIAPTVIVAEGLLMYLPPEAVGALVEQCAAVTGGAVRRSNRSWQSHCLYLYRYAVEREARRWSLDVAGSVAPESRRRAVVVEHTPGGALPVPE
jgi:methyltransferase (TIGR00027 family)